MTRVSHCPEHLAPGMLPHSWDLCVSAAEAATRALCGARPRTPARRTNGRPRAMRERPYVVGSAFSAAR